MQIDIFGESKPEEALPPLSLCEDPSSEYKPRTVKNAKADVTVAFAIDFESAGERLTRKEAGARYIAVPFGEDVSKSASRLVAFWSSRQAQTLNVAGNGIYTWAQHGVSQLEVNQWIYDVLKVVSQQVRLKSIRSGGQTGSDLAGLVAALALNVPAIGLYPKGFRMRGASKQEIYSDEVTIEKRLAEYADRLSR